MIQPVSSLPLHFDAPSGFPELPGLFSERKPVGSDTKLDAQLTSLNHFAALENPTLTPNPP